MAVATERESFDDPIDNTVFVDHHDPQPPTGNTEILGIRIRAKDVSSVTSRTYGLIFFVMVPPIRIYYEAWQIIC